MTNQTKVFSVIDVDAGTGIATVTADVDQFVLDGLGHSFCNFKILPVVVTPYYRGGSAMEKNWYSVQVNYYDPSIY